MNPEIRLRENMPFPSFWEEDGRFSFQKNLAVIAGLI